MHRFHHAWILPVWSTLQFPASIPDGLVCDTTQPTLFSEPSHIDQSVIAAYNKFLRESRQDEPSSRVVIAHQIKEGPGCSIRFSDTYVEAESLLCRDGETSPDKPGHAHKCLKTRSSHSQVNYFQMPAAFRRPGPAPGRALCSSLSSALRVSQ